jgi:hypothetical protein
LSIKDKHWINSRLKRVLFSGMLAAVAGAEADQVVLVELHSLKNLFLVEAADFCEKSLSPLDHEFSSSLRVQQDFFSFFHKKYFSPKSRPKKLFGICESSIVLLLHDTCAKKVQLL